AREDVAALSEVYRKEQLHIEKKLQMSKGSASPFEPQIGPENGSFDQGQTRGDRIAVTHRKVTINVDEHITPTNHLASVIYPRGSG
ncbi:unnamed protein product, partial [Amoebophrya sp. A25]